MYEVAATIGMPATFVDLRHECAHADPPSRRRLERSVGQALEWMWEIYWSRLGEEGQEELTSTETECDLLDSDDEEEEAFDGSSEDENAGDVLEKQRLQDSLRVVLKNYLAARKEVLLRRPRNVHDVSAARSEEPGVRTTYKELMQICNRKRFRLRVLQSVFLEVRMMLPSTDAYV